MQKLPQVNHKWADLNTGAYILKPAVMDMIDYYRFKQSTNTLHTLYTLNQLMRDIEGMHLEDMQEWYYL